MRGVLRRIFPLIARTLGAARARVWNRHNAPITAVLIVSDAVDPGPIAERLVQQRSRAWSRWLHELIVVTTGVQAPGEPIRLPNSPPTRHVHVPEEDPAIVINTAIALATSEAVAFFDQDSAPIRSAALGRMAGALRGPVDALLLLEDAPVNEGSLDRLLKEVRTPTQTAFRRRGLIDAGLLHPEHREASLSEALTRAWRNGRIFALVRPSDPTRLIPLPRSSIKQVGEAEEDRPARVVYLVNGTDVRGGIRIVFEHCNRLRDAGVEAMVVTFDEPLQTWFPGLRAPLLNGRDFPSTDVAVATFWTTANFVAQLDCARYYFIQHDEALFEQDPDWTAEVRKTYRLPLEFVTISQWLVDLIRTHARKEAVLVPNGINRDMFYPDPAFPRGDKVRVLVEGNRDIFWKGMEEAEQVLAGLDVEVWTLGKTGIDGDRDFPYPPQDDLRRIYASCDILLKTSWYEGMPLPHMEAMACGCVLVTTDVPGVRDYCADGWNCLMAPPRDVPAIRAALVRAVDDIELRRSLASNGLRTAAERFGWEDKIELLATTYREAAAVARSRFAAAGELRRSNSQTQQAADPEPLQ
jgi:hypothetical protein